MTRLFYGSTVLAGLCAMTLVIGCGGSSSPKVTCDGGNCGDAKKDTSGAKLDGQADVVVKLDGQAPTDGLAKLDGPAPTLDGPAPTLDGPAPTLDGPAPTLDGPAPTLDGPAPTTDGPAGNLDGPAPKLDGPAGNLDGPAPKLDSPAGNLDAPKLDGANLDGTVTPPADASDGGVASDGPDAPVVDAPVIIVDAPADTAPDLVVVTADAADGAADAAASDVTLVSFGDGGCEGDACHAYTFQDDKLDGGTDAVLAPGFTVVTTGGTPGTWDLVQDGSNVVLEGTGLGVTSFAEAPLPPATSTDETIEVRMRFKSLPVPADPNSVVRICGRFDGTGGVPSTDAYCLEITTQTGDAGSTNGTMTIDQRNAGVLSTPATAATNLDIMVGEWHTYRFSISGAGPVALKGYFDGVLKVTAADNPATYTSGTVALGVRAATADFDNLIVSTP